MSNITKLNNILCYDINAIDGIVASDIVKWDAIEFCVSPTPTPTPSVTPTPTPTPGGASPTPTPTITPTPTPTPVPCDPGCCERELCYGGDCNEACNCVNSATFYLHQPCQNDPCDLAYADGIFEDSRCGTPAREGYFTDGQGDCWYWDGVSTLTNQGGC